MKLLILLRHRFSLWSAPAWFVARLRADFPRLAIVQLDSYDAIAHELPDSDIFIGWSLKPEQLALAQRLRWIHSPAAAVHGLLSPELAATNITVTNSSAVHGPVVAEHALALMLALAKRIPSAVRYQDQHTWAQQLLWDESPRPRELSGSTLALIGYGAIGREVARLAAAFGMKVIAVRAHPLGKIFHKLHGIETIFYRRRFYTFLSSDLYFLFVKIETNNAATVRFQQFGPYRNKN